MKTPTTTRAIYLNVSSEVYVHLDQVRRTLQRQTGHKVSLGAAVLALLQEHPRMQATAACTEESKRCLSTAP